ncbi:xylulokinase [Lonepinella koalarum]|uniref:xylulokinase n=1 Tax=Lonepinella koalarum TaxID=53417 RepID=UPI003F6DAA53
MKNTAQYIQSGQAVLGIEFGSTRIKAVLINQQGEILATGIADWENHFDNGIWTYSEAEIWQGLQQSYVDLSQNVQAKYQVTLTKLSAIGISAMMHGYLPFDKQDNLLVPFRTWRNNFTQKSSQKLTALFNHNIPQRWSISHLYQAILNNEPHVAQIDYFTTLAGYVHWRLTDEKVLGIGDASGMFPIDSERLDYDQTMLQQFDQLISEKQYSWHIKALLPKVLLAGDNAGFLSEKGAKLLDPAGNLQANIPFCPPEGDAGTGMVATNSIKEKTGNISAGTSAFAMIVLEKALSKVYPELDIVTTPTGKLVAMAHANNCSSEINAWVHLFNEVLQAFDVNVNSQKLYETLFNQALKGSPDCGGLLAYGFHSGEHIVGLGSGCPMFIHPTNAEFNVANFMLSHLYAAFGAMKLGVDILLQQENVNIEQILAHGGMFKTQGIAQKVLASALNIPVAIMQTAGEGGAWGIALLANFLGKNNTLSEYLDHEIFIQSQLDVVKPEPTIHQGYEKFIKQYQQGIAIVQTAIEHIK